MPVERIVEKIVTKEVPVDRIVEVCGGRGAVGSEGEGKKGRRGVGALLDRLCW